MNPDEHDELTAAAIARLAGVGRAAVANWRRRYPEFPKPIGGTPHSPTFSRAEVEAWLKETGKGDQLATAGRTDTGTQRVEDDSSSGEDLRDEWTRRALDLTPERGIADLLPAQLLARVMVSLLPPSTAAARLPDADTVDVPAVLDPACFNATLLMAVADRFGDGVTLVGQEIQESAAAVAAFNLRSNYDVTYEIHTGDSLLDDRLDAYLGAASAVVCEPPFDKPQWPSAELATDPRWQFGIPAPRDGELAWVQHCYAHLRLHGVAVVAVTPRTCVQPSGQSVRSALVRSGVLRDVIALPKGMGSVPDTNLHLWIMQRPQSAPDHRAVWMVDLSGLGDAADVPHEFAAWQRLFDDADPTIFRAVPRLELLDGDADLRPSRHVTANVRASADDFARVTDRLANLYAYVGRGLPRFAAPSGPTRHSYVTFGELERAGALVIRSREDTPRAGDLLVRTLGRVPVVATGTADDDTGIAQLVEIDSARLDAHFLAAFLGTDANALPVANTLGALNREDLRRCRVPRLPLAEQRRYGDAFRHLQEVEDALTKLGKVSGHVIDQTVNGLTTGVLAPDFTVMNKTDVADAADEETTE
ncbi:N-6 DNA methylase [Actinomadura syzygii]|uniref:N-6 DNA methylase n=1 Tax=Actinomadura syzygii TaxID=1427538 RepID=A0A5D0UA74_9ACTN|nr:N-6 DNA methylase [Actinomadura syzygii]TYC14690.1 N-6 DNA methylase [Actinomadura syzygii]